MRIANSKLFLSIAAAAGLSVAAAMPAMAQPEAPTPPEPQHERPQPQMPQQQQANVDVSDAEVEKFANVYNQTAEVRQEYTQKLQNAEDQKEAQKIQREANEEIKGVIEESPLTIERYQEIARATAQDTELRQRILEATKQ